MPSISVVIPAWNSARFLPDALDSVEGQSRRALEIIVVDDASTDGTAALAEAAGARVVRLERNSGPSAARNAGIEAARGELVAFLDADDWWEPEHLALVVDLLERFPEAILAFSMMFREAGSPVFPLPPSETPVRGIDWLFRGNPIPQSAVVARRAALLAAGGYRTDMRFAEDYDLWLRLAARSFFVCTHAATLHHRAHPAQLSRQEARMAAAAWQARERAWAAALPSLSPPDRTRLAQDLVSGWEDDLRSAWHIREREPLATLMAQASRVPGADSVRRRWEARIRWLRPLWLPAARCWDLLPAWLRNRLRRDPAGRGSPPLDPLATDLPRRAPALAGAEPGDA